MKEEPSARRWWHCRGMLCAVGKRKSAEKKPANLQLSMFRAELETHVLIQMLQEHTPFSKKVQRPQAHMNSIIHVKRCDQWAGEMAPVAKSTGCFSRGPGFNSLNTWKFTTICNWLWSQRIWLPSGTRHTCSTLTTVKIHTYMHTQSQISTFYFNFLFFSN